MADIQGVVSQVEGACGNYKTTQSEMQQLETNIQMLSDESEHIARELSSIEDQVIALQAQANAVMSNIDSNSGNEDYDSGSDLATLNRIRAQLQGLQSESALLEQQRMQTIQQLNAARSIYIQKKEYLDTLRNYLEAVRTQMTNAADTLQNKILQLENAISVFNGASGNMFGGSALQQAGNLSGSKNEYQANLTIAQNVLEMIRTTLDNQGSSNVKVLRR
ncbi:hypothetical protein [Butyrivibrio sp. AC2005]|uniref:hypothetical protein n=1 Tax=Butyrivibrio sp. AC2005 TaxID=1280672 RepID=UPI000426C4B7|nr:hypothetical protein [Butyrivibrio sp. AC2005]